jgi:hypothetical protein
MPGFGVLFTPVYRPDFLSTGTPVKRLANLNSSENIACLRPSDFVCLKKML